MIAFVRVASVKPGKTSAALAFAKEIAAYIRSAHQRDLEVLMPIGGEVQRVAWSARHNDLAELEAAMDKMLGDPKYWEMVNGVADNFIAGSFHDGIWKVV
jgi:membrane-bound lytic murein transglycosylase MltF